MRSIQEASFECILRPERLFCDLPADVMKDFDALKSPSLYLSGRMLFREGSRARGIFVLCEGKVKLSVCSPSGKRLTLRIAGPGEVLGLRASLCNGPYELTAEIVDDARVAMINRKDLLQFLNDHRETCLQLAQLLSHDLHVAYNRMRRIGPWPTPTAILADQVCSSAIHCSKRKRPAMISRAPVAGISGSIVHADFLISARKSITFPRCSGGIHFTFL